MFTTVEISRSGPEGSAWAGMGFNNERMARSAKRLSLPPKLFLMGAASLM